MSASSGTLSSRRTIRSRLAGMLVSPRFARWALLAAVFGVLEALTRNGAISRLTLAPPSSIVHTAYDEVQTRQFLTDLGQTAEEVAISCGIGVGLGVVVGLLAWRFPLLGTVLEPYLIALYSMPLVVFYPILLAIFGIGLGPIVAIASVAALVPVAINVTVALRSVAPVLHKLGRSLNCSPVWMWRSILIPAATPLAAPGLRLGFIYSMIATIGMEFVLAGNGLGFRIGYYFRQFDVADMWGMILIVALIAILINTLIGFAERRLRRDLS